MKGYWLLNYPSHSNTHYLEYVFQAPSIKEIGKEEEGKRERKREKDGRRERKRERERERERVILKEV